MFMIKRRSKAVSLVTNELRKKKIVFLFIFSMKKKEKYRTKRERTMQKDLPDYGFGLPRYV